MSQRPILVTGGAGFIASHTCKRLRTEGFVPIAYDNLSTGNRRSVRWGPLLEADIDDTSALVAACGRYQPEALVHFAASAYVGESVVDPEKYYRTTYPERFRFCVPAAKRACVMWCSRAVAPFTATSLGCRSTKARLLAQSAPMAGPN